MSTVTSIPSTIDDNSSSSSSSQQEEKRALLLGMVYSKETNPSRGQGYRDRIRCESLENYGGYIVDTLDNKHDENLAKLGHHCRANFADTKRMFKDLQLIWNFDGNIPRYDLIILDYFFSPAGWVNTRWTEKFFTSTIPEFRGKNLLKLSGEIWLPNNIYVQEMIQKHHKILSKYYTWNTIKDPQLNPLYSCTDHVKDELLKCPDNITNDTQIPYLLTSGDGPFVCFQPKIQNEINTNSTGKKRKDCQEVRNCKKSSSSRNNLESTSSSLSSSDGRTSYNQDLLILSDDDNSNLLVPGITSEEEEMEEREKNISNERNKKRKVTLSNEKNDNLPTSISGV